MIRLDLAIDIADLSAGMTFSEDLYFVLYFWRRAPLIAVAAVSDGFVSHLRHCLAVSAFIGCS